MMLKVTAVNLQEHKSILAFLDRVLHEAADEPLDLEADAIIRAYFKRNPEMAYRLTKLAMQRLHLGLETQAVAPRRWRRLLLFR